MELKPAEESIRTLSKHYVLTDFKLVSSFWLPFNCCLLCNISIGPYACYFLGITVTLEDCPAAMVGDFQRMSSAKQTLKC